MTRFLKTLSVSTLAMFAVAACSTTDDKLQVGVDDNDKYSSPDDGTSAELAENQKFHMHPDGDGDHMMDKKMKHHDIKDHDMDKGKMHHKKMHADGMSHDKIMSSDYPMVGGAAMYPSKTIVENASQADNLTTLVAAVKQAELVDTLSGPGPFTVFAPTNAAFSLLPEETTTMLMMNDNRADLQKVLTAHVIPDKVTASDLMMWIKPTGSYTAETVSGDMLTFYMIDGKVKIADENGTLATVTTADVQQSNGVVHVINSVLVPK